MRFNRLGAMRWGRGGGIRRPRAIGDDGFRIGGTQAGDFNAAANTAYLVNGVAAARTVTLPGSPAVGDKIWLATYGDNSTIVNPNALKINGATGDLTLPPYWSGPLTYTGTDSGWV